MSGMTIPDLHQELAPRFTWFPGGSAVVEYIDKTLSCIECGQEFTFTAGEQLFFADKGLSNEPKRCKPCKHRKNERINAIMHSQDGRPPRAHVEVVVKCAQCEVETTVPFRPTQGRPVYCRDCFAKMRDQQTVTVAASDESSNPV